MSWSGQRLLGHRIGGLQTLLLLLGIREGVSEEGGVFEGGVGQSIDLLLQHCLLGRRRIRVRQRWEERERIIASPSLQGLLEVSTTV